MRLGTSFDPAVFRARRERLARALGTRAALLPAGEPRARNYPANVYPFRAESHFLYFFGIPIPGAMGLVDGAQAVLFLPPPEPDAALWHGATPSFDDLAQMSGLEVRSLAELGPALAGRSAGTVSTHDRVTAAAVAEILGRPLDQSRPTDDDLALADAIIPIRLSHDPAALASMRRAIEATAAAHRAGRDATKPGRTEAQVWAAMEGEIASRGMTVAYSSIVTVHGEVLHNVAHDDVVGPRDLLLADVGAESPDGWASDVTRTWPASSFSSTQRDIYDVVLSANRTCIEMVRPGVRYRDIHLTACRVITKGLVALGLLTGDVEELVADGVHALFFPHGVGHLLGLDVHDMEDLGDRAGYASGRTRSSQFGLCYLRLDRDLTPGMAVTIEPGIYFVPAILEDPRLTAVARDRLVRSELPRFADVRGIRIEDDVLCTTSTPEVLTVAIPK